MEWFFAFDENASDWFSDMVKVAVLSAKRHTSLTPRCLYDGHANALTAWLENEGVQVIFHEVPFKNELSANHVVERNKTGHYTPAHASGAFLRVEAARFAAGEQFLYTDCDVMFLRDIPTLDIKGIAAVEEHSGNFNSGVLFANRDLFLNEYANLIEHFRANGFYDLKHCSYDQVLLNSYFSGRWDKLPSVLNWRPWMGVNHAASIVHFHGPKPTRARAILEGRGLVEEAGLRAFIERDEDAYRYYLGRFEDFLPKHPVWRRLFNKANNVFL